MSQLASYKRYWEPNLTQVVGVSLPIGALTTLITQPIEFVKTRIQIRAEGIGILTKNQFIGINAHKVFREIHETGCGLRGFYVGIEAALFSRLGYLFLRNIFYKTIYDANKPRKVTNDLTIRQKAIISGFSGGLAAFLTNPFELIMVRQIADGGLPSYARRNYLNFFDAYSRIIVQEGGSQALFKGSIATVLKAISVNASLTGPYDYLREKLWITFGDFGFIDTVATIWASFWGTLFTLPIDNIKTKLQRANDDPSKNRLTYRNLTDAVRLTLNIEGLQSFYVGAYPYFVKMFILCLLTTNLTHSATYKWKKQAGLQEWQI